MPIWKGFHKIFVIFNKVNTIDDEKPELLGFSKRKLPKE